MSTEQSARIKSPSEKRKCPQNFLLSIGGQADDTSPLSLGYSNTDLPSSSSWPSKKTVPRKEQIASDLLGLALLHSQEMLDSAIRHSYEAYQSNRTYHNVTETFLEGDELVFDSYFSLETLSVRREYFDDNKQAWVGANVVVVRDSEGYDVTTSDGIFDAVSKHSVELCPQNLRSR